ncbi:MAG: glycosyl hydrolase-related protein, partial [Candidatus Caldatribacteriaceae bacterium]
TTESLVPEISWVRYTPSVQRIRIAYAMNLPRGLTEDRKRRQSERIPCPLILEVQLTSGMKRLDFRVYFENRVLEHRLQVVFLSPFSTAISYAGAHFAVLPREGKKNFPQNEFVLIQEGGMSMAILSQGLREYTLLARSGKTGLAITLLRAVGWLSRNDLLTRKGDAGWSLPTPGGQCLGRYEFSLALRIGRETFPESTIPWEALCFNRPPLLFQLKEKNLPITEWSLLCMDNPRILLSALKKSEWGEELVLRLYNPTPREEACVLTFTMPILRIRELSLLEKEEGILLLSGNTLPLIFGPYEIKTLGILVSPEDAI